MTFWGGWKNSLLFLNNMSVDHNLSSRHHTDRKDVSIMVGELPLPLLHPLLPCSTIPASKKRTSEIFNGTCGGIKENRFSLTISKSSCLLTNTTTIEKF